MTREQHTAERPLYLEIERYADSRITAIQRGYLRGDSSAKATLARLRSAVPTDPERAIDAWENVFVDPPERLVGSSDDLSPAERSLVTTLHLYGVHQQSSRTAMHERGVGLGHSIRKLANPTDADSRERPVMRRYHAFITAPGFAERVHHLSGLIRQFKSAEVRLDYARLAADLYRIEFPEGRTAVRIAWSRQLVYHQPAEQSA